MSVSNERLSIHLPLRLGLRAGESVETVQLKMDRWVIFTKIFIFFKARVANIFLLNGIIKMLLRQARSQGLWLGHKPPPLLNWVCKILVIDTGSFSRRAPWSF